MDYIKYDEFINNLSSKIDDLDLDKNTINFWLSRNFYLQMMDIWGEVNKLKQLKDKNAIKNQLKRISNYLTIVRESKINNFKEEVKKTLRIAEWELYDFYLWNNEFHNTIDTVSNWFDQWCFSINYDLLE